MELELTRDELLTLMQDLPANHWMQNKLLSTLTVHSNLIAVPVTTTAPMADNRNWDEEFTTKYQCEWETYGVQCRQHHTIKDALGRYFCTEHANLKCRNCGNPANHGCPEELQFVCGAPVCENCRRCH